MYPAVVEQDGRPVACGLGVLDGEWVGLLDICTVPSMRRMGLATQVVCSILGWALARGAWRAWLQVVEENIAAISLYRKLGFDHLYSYWYRVKTL
jgi:N-acetylglutamate synthase